MIKNILDFTFWFIFIVICFYILLFLQAGLFYNIFYAIGILTVLYFLKNIVLSITKKIF